MVAAVGSISGIVAGLFMAFLSVRFNHKLFLLIGLSCTCMSAVAFFFAPNFPVVLITNVGVGAGIAIVSSMVYSLIGEFYPLQKRDRAIGWIVASSTLAFVLGAPLIGIIASASNWRSVMIWLVLPISLTSLILALIAIPKESNRNPITEKESYLSGLKEAVSNSSAFASLFVTMLIVSEASISYYTVAFFTSRFGISEETGSLIIMVGNILATVGGLAAGFFVNRVGRKSLGTITLLIAASLTLTFTFAPNFSLSWGLNALRFLFAGMTVTASSSLIIEQIPKFRGTMMSLNMTFTNLGMLLATIAGGLAINFFNYQTMALILGSLGVAGVAIWMTFVKDPWTK